jgi:aryl-phospho-beta-D-glucosidase BglC (GH1 family)
MKTVKRIIMVACLLWLVACSAENKGKYEGPNISGTDDPDNPTGAARCRGIGITQLATTEADFRRMAGWGVNHVRWLFENWSADMPNQTVAQYLAWISNQCDRLEAALPYLAEQGITVSLNIHHPPRNRDENNGNVMRMFRSKELQDAFVEGWRIIAERFKDSTTIVYYDLLNEPAEGSIDPSCKNWRNLAIETANAISAIDNTKKFIFEKEDIYKNFQPLPGNNWIYSIHMYTPHVLTHQGVSAPLGVSYPATITDDIYNWPAAPDYWDKATLRRFLDEICDVFDFVRNNNVEIYVGEFGCARWAPNHSAYNYIRDCLEIFEEEGWHWVYFCDLPTASDNIAANTWSAQYNEVYGSTQPVSEPTDRLLLLQNYWARNAR